MELRDKPNLVRPYSNVYEFKTLLLVDDDHQLAETLQWILADENFLVDVSHDGDEAMLKVDVQPRPPLRGCRFLVNSFAMQSCSIREALDVTRSLGKS
jgi:DNA-binding NtrC family response regulator